MEERKNELVLNLNSNIDIALLEQFRERAQPMRKLMSYYQCAIMEVETKFKVLSEQFNSQHNRNPIETIKSRLKDGASLIGKLKRRQLELTCDSAEENISDIAGVRVICSFIDDIYFLADCLLAQDDIALVDRKDYIVEPKPNGYRSLHLIVMIPIFLAGEKKQMKVEIQLRTIAMDFWASLEHTMRYKKNQGDEKLASLIAVELEECASQGSALDKKMQNIRNMIDNN